MHRRSVLPDLGQLRTKAVFPFTFPVPKGTTGGRIGGSSPDLMRRARCLAKVRGVEAAFSSSG